MNFGRLLLRPLSLLFAFSIGKIDCQMEPIGELVAGELVAGEHLFVSCSNLPESLSLSLFESWPLFGRFVFALAISILKS